MITQQQHSLVDSSNKGLLKSYLFDFIQRTEGILYRVIKCKKKKLSKKVKINQG